MKESLRLIATIAAFCALSALLLAWTNNVTREPIAAARKAETLDALREVLPPCDNDAMADAVTIEADGTEWTFYVGRQQGEYVGTAFKARSEDGYAGTIVLLAGVLPDGTLNGIRILESNETPGLGAKIKDAAFRDQFKGRSGRDTAWVMVKKDGGDVVAITGATISSRAVSAALKRGLDVLNANEAAIRAAPVTTPSQEEQP